MILPSAYLPPISWFVSLLRDEPIFIEQYENYHKQTIRNRCTIDSPNGPLHLTIPIERSTFQGGHCLMKDVRISPHTDWQRQHWYAIETSYYNSPFFEYLQDDFRPFYERPYTFLIDFNEALTQKCLELLDLHPTLARTKHYTPSPRPSTLNSSLLTLNSSLLTLNYYQVFSHKHGFLPDLSIIDLIFNMGNEAPLILTTTN